MVISQNGWSANDITKTQVYEVPGTTLRIRLRKGDAGFLLVNLTSWFHSAVEPIDEGQLDDWGYAERTVRGSTTSVSNHASGTAIDLNALRHPLGVRNTFTDEQERRIRARLRLYEGCIRWGGDYQNRPDEMHFEIVRSPAEVARVAAKLRKDWLTMATQAEYEASTRKIVREELLRLFGDNPNDKAGGPDIGRARVVHPNTGTVSSLAHLLYGTDERVRSIESIVKE